MKNILSLRDVVIKHRDNYRKHRNDANTYPQLHINHEYSVTNMKRSRRNFYRAVDELLHALGED